jgi:hypothetical protein
MGKYLIQSICHSNIFLEKYCECIPAIYYVNDIEDVTLFLLVVMNINIIKMEMNEYFLDNFVLWNMNDILEISNTKDKMICWRRKRNGKVQ